MINLGLTAGEGYAFEVGLCRDHAVSTTVTVMSMDHKVLGVADVGVISGQVDVDSSQDVERTCQVEVLDPSNRLGLAGSGPTQPIIYVNKMIQVTYDVLIPTLGRWVHVPIFTGPITKADETSGQVSITASGKESLLTTSTSMSATYKKGSRKSDIIASFLQRSGETQRQITAWSDRTTADLTISGADAPWPVLQSLAHTLGNRSAGTDPWLGYDGSGICRLKSHSSAVQWIFHQGDGGSITSVPKVSADESAMRNYVRVISSDSKVLAVSHAPASDPFSAANLGRGGVPRYVREDVQTDTTDKKAAQKLADSTRDALLKAAVSVEFESLIVPHLEPRDVIRVVAPTWEWDLQVSKFTIPLGASQAMSHGRNAQIRPKIKYAARGRTR